MKNYGITLIRGNYTTSVRQINLNVRSCLIQASAKCIFRMYQHVFLKNLVNRVLALQGRKKAKSVDWLTLKKASAQILSETDRRFRSNSVED